MSNPAASSNYAPIGLNREQSARHIGIGRTLFDQMVIDGRMPPPKHINSRRVWNRVALEQAFEQLPDDDAADDDNPWDRI